MAAFVTQGKKEKEVEGFLREAAAAIESLQNNDSLYITIRKED